MSIIMEPDTLALLWAAAGLPYRESKNDGDRRLSRIAKARWAYSTSISDLLEDYDRRLARHSLPLTIEDLAQAFGYRFEDICDRPRSRSASAMLLPALSAATLAALMCDLHHFGFVTPAAEMCALITPTLKNRTTVTSAELSVLWSERAIGKSEVSIRAQTESQPAEYDEGRLPTGHRYFVTLDDGGKPLSVDIRGPRHRQTPPPVSRICAACGREYMHGDPDSSASHRKYHRKVMNVVSPTALPKMTEHMEMHAEPDLVVTASPTWMHREMYGRAAAFRREMQYDFVQWSSDDRDMDPDARGHLLVDAEGVIHGACAFRLRRTGNQSRWGLQWVRIRPDARRSGLLSKRWNDFRTRYGDFHVEGPVSEAMEAFLQARGDGHLMD